MKNILVPNAQNLPIIIRNGWSYYSTTERELKALHKLSEGFSYSFLKENLHHALQRNFSIVLKPLKITGPTSAKRWNSREQTIFFRLHLSIETYFKKSLAANPFL